MATSRNNGIVTPVTSSICWFAAKAIPITLVLLAACHPYEPASIEEASSTQRAADTAVQRERNKSTEELLQTYVGKSFWIPEFRTLRICPITAECARGSITCLCNDKRAGHYKVTSFDVEYPFSADMVVQFDDGETGKVHIDPQAIATLGTDRDPMIARRDEQQRREESQTRQRAEGAKEEAARQARGGVRIGMTEAAVLASSWGRPNHINRTTMARRETQQWVYPGNNFLYFENGILTVIDTRN